MGITVSVDDVVYVADAGARLVRVFDTGGNVIRSFGQDGACVFDAIRDVDAASKSTGKTRGIGLQAMAERMKLLNGIMVISSNPSMGTSVIFTLSRNRN